MSASLAVLLFLGLLLNAEMMVEAATFIETTPHLWIESESPSAPWANVTLQCCSKNMAATGFQLLKDGEVFSFLPLLGLEGKFLLGPVTADNVGVYRCQAQWSNGLWSSVSDPVEVMGTDPLPAPSLRAIPGPWILEGVETELHCQGQFLGMIFDLHQEGKKEPVNSTQETGVEATFIIRSPGTYSCHYRPPTPSSGVRSASSETIQVVIPDSLPKPSLSSWDNLVAKPGNSVTFRCASRFSGLEFKLFKDGEEVHAHMQSSTDPTRINFHLNDLEAGNGGKYSCQYRFWKGPQIWSEDSNSLELVLTTGTLPKPSLSVQPQDAVISRGTNVTLQCQGSHPNVRFALLKKDSVVQILSPSGPRADFVLPDAMADHTGKYSCIYFETVAPFAGSSRSEEVEIQVDGLLPKPTLWSLSPAVIPGKDAVLRCSGRVSNAEFQLFKEGEDEKLEIYAKPFDAFTADFVLVNSKPQDGGNYKCRYVTRTEPFLSSETSDPAELLVTGAVFELHKEGEWIMPRQLTLLDPKTVKFLLSSLMTKDSGSGPLCVVV